ncbi:Bug family tripartite tricarboxylate transporter substrate binding protein [Aquabacter spiritensis]|uniref:Tripartite-type tricarboxylate transporter receptor subunit TctC n=1 Tax=Aquabacter spiritensis TaxID=933073 RepID=A0A4R3M8Z6_9HYPH|nr:tripartite tricarboxylate transporter substrate-binding protein [Aquabacter spiritensis]TCT08157.1 tripartite-type tricarboxylate transporter receptor subunit TctC [Aquabacter spiritensis]
MRLAVAKSAQRFAAVCAALAALSPLSALAWEPTKTVEFIVPAGTGGGADQMARMLQGIIQKNSLMKQNLVVINKSGGAGAEGFLDVKGSAGNPHKIIITLSNLFTTPLATGVPFKWDDLTPVSMLALDEFVLWVNAKAPYNDVKGYLADLKAAGSDAKFKMGGTGSKQEDQIITAAIEQKTGAKFIYVPYKGGGDVAAQLVGGHITSSVNNPIEAVSQWRAGELKPLCVFDSQRMPYKELVTADKSWGDIPTCKEAGLDIEYLMLRGIFTAPRVTKDQVDYYVNLFKQVRDTPEWKDFMQKGAFNTTMLTGEEYKAWLGKAAESHRALMENAGFIAK